MAELEDKIDGSKKEVMNRKMKLGAYSAQFFQLDEGARASKQRLGAVAAVIETKKIIAREFERLRKEDATTEAKLNTAKEANAQICAQINGLRNDTTTYRKLAARLMDELSTAKSRIVGIKHARDEAYLERDRAQEEMREVAKQFELGSGTTTHASIILLSNHLLCPLESMVSMCRQTRKVGVHIGEHFRVSVLLGMRYRLSHAQAARMAGVCAGYLPDYIHHFQS